MSAKLSKSDLQKVEKLTKLFRETYNQDLTLEENLAQFFITLRPGTFPEDAHDVVEGLKIGINTFNDNLKEGLSEAGIDYKVELDKVTKDMDLKQKYDLYVNFLAALISLNVDNLTKEQQAEVDDFQSVRDGFKVEGDVTEEMIDEVLRKIGDQLENNVICLGSTQNLMNLISALPEGSEKIELAITGSEEDVRNKLVSSLAAFIAYQNGDIGGITEQNVSPEAIAVVTATSIEELRVVNDANTGRINANTAVRILKIIGEVAVITLVSFAMAASIAFLPFQLPSFLSLMFMIPVLTMGAALLSWMSFSFAENLFDVIDKASETYSHRLEEVLTTWRDSTWPGIRKSVHDAFLWLQRFIQDRIISRILQGQHQRPEVQVAPNQ